MLINDHILCADATSPGALTSLHRYHVANHLEDDLPLPPVDPLSPVLPEAHCSGVSPPSTTTLPPPSVLGSPTSGSYTPSPSPPPPPPFTYGTPYTPPSYQPSPALSPPYYYNYEPSPPTFSFPSPPVFEPPVVYPPPTGPPPPHSEPESALWCVAKPSVPDPIIQEAMNYACGSGADCEALQPNGDCFQPDTLFAHASYAFNSYWQRTKAAGGTCEFGGSAMLVTVDPSTPIIHKTISFHQSGLIILICAYRL
ncbi:hypothetical protein L1987_09282 [Smallanthus sonchifolius]|uniref:Uncharacterized protein n=1 Tax=Smallanthus sonchifolius TaxID=185202 RepID=A0ACB9JPB6_9ASTR|nr:hypothetical protein L1987_09282 [Smallanthus sonchifolius]